MSKDFSLLLKSIIKRLTNSGVNTAEIDARLLLAYSLGVSKTGLVLNNEKAFDNSKMLNLYEMVDRRCNREPVSRIIGKREFWSMEFDLSPETLDPRHDTEIIIDTALYLQEKDSLNFTKLLDLGTGSGCILLSLLSEIKMAIGYGVDISFGAIKTAKRNSDKLGFANRTYFFVGNWIDSIQGKFDLVVCNPPYIKLSEIYTLEPEVRNYDPMFALSGGQDGLDSYRHILSDLTRVLVKNGKIVLEIGYDQKESVESMLQSVGFAEIQSHKDLSGTFRCISATRL